MGDVMDEVHAIAQCKDCPWYKTCVSPMKFTPEDIKRQIEASGSMMVTDPFAEIFTGAEVPPLAITVVLVPPRSPENITVKF